MSLASRYLVSTVPWWLYPFYISLSSLLGFAHFFWHTFVHYTNRIVVEGRPYKQERFPAVYVYWHEYSFTNFSAHHYWSRMQAINHPFWYMKHVHIGMYLLGYRKLFLGSTGAGGRQAAIDLAASLKKSPGACTFVNPDGPNGPYRVLRKGCLHIAKDSCLPIIACGFQSSRGIRFGGWDNKLFPLPFGIMKIKYSEPIYIDSLNFEAAKLKVEKALEQVS